jgi:glycopeptide antibiotics resistance protein
MKLIRKLLLLIPVIILGMIFLERYSSRLSGTSAKRLLFFSISFLFLFCFFLYDTLRRREGSLWMKTVQSSFYVYLFMVLSLTGYFILFREGASGGWWERMVQRVENGDRVNLHLFRIFSIYHFSDKQILGNLALLFPFGMYLPLLFPKRNRFFSVLIASLLFSVIIETIQLITRFRVADIDDVLLNTTGALLGFILFQLLSWLRASNPSGKTEALA